MKVNLKGHSEIVDWDWMRAKGDEICSEMFTFIKSIAQNGKDFSVSMMFKMVENGENGFTMMSRGSDNAAYTPNSYRVFVPENKAEKAYYKEVFDKNPTKPQILMDKREIKDKFDDTGKIDYSQFIAIPISCKGKTVGIIQIAAYNDSIVSYDKAEIERFCNNYFSIATNCMLLTNKNENISQII